MTRHYVDDPETIYDEICIWLPEFEPSLDEFQSSSTLKDIQACQREGKSLIEALREVFWFQDEV